MIAPIQIKNTLKEYFGYDKFRPLQEDIINSIFNGHDNLVIMPTGGGKSICFQLPALLLEGITIVISPLIALMKDQVDGLTTNGIAAAYLNSSQNETEQQEIYTRIAAGELKLLYTAPESLTYLENIFSSETISLIAIDEAHCISSWGHDFRPAYTNLGYLKKRFPKIPVIALTATADKATREDIANQLNIPHATQHIASFDRKNLKLEVRPANDRVKQIISFIDERPNESGIIYCLSRKATEAVAEKLQGANINAAAYHAGIAHEKRSKIQEDFINDNCQVICATIAFGMGIDKSNVRWVIHYNLPKNIEGYYQEIGRAGRDGLPSNTLLFHSYGDVIQLQKFAQNSGNVEVQLAKLDRMKEYADALSCRRKILLSYFGELISEDCGNCDVCQNPPQFFDGTIIAQKALSTVARLDGQEPIGVVIDVLRGSQNSTIQEKGYQNLKTYGIAKDIAWLDWKQYVTQLVNLGYLEIAFHENNKLKLTEFAKDVLFNGKKVDLANLVEAEKHIEEQKVTATKAKKNSLFERLRLLRLKIAKEENVPAYQIFNDATLKEIEMDRPMSEDEFVRISGVGKVKLMNYGHQFIKEVIDFTGEKKSKRKGDTTKKTYELYQQGLSISEIAKERKLAETTIFSHISKLFAEGKDIDLTQFIDKHDLESIKTAKKELEDPNTLKAYFEHFEEAIPYSTIRIGLTILDKEDS
ncbi:DNA helicase RecQ [Kordia sp. YSTF-M3]|uniref:DNA helicase RecQ n=1 Tax=Kordia aestuariivivens TaxID=2759037 RepID=A0ABR7Q7Q6_9FLAO|nr:DNA helicase RecQ [Kordia aestuariivivens]MBC8754578.1 DNA helicase RecQ [Kordia aestuariivivens]